MGLGDCLICLKESDAAVEAYLRAAELRPSAAGEVWNRLGNGFAKAGLHTRAAAAFANAIAAESQNRRYALRLAESFAAQGQNDLAADILRRA